MADVVFMFWLLWILFILVYFFMRKSVWRTIYIIWLLLVISTATLYVPLGRFMISVAWLLIFGGVIFCFGWANFQLKHILHMFIVMIGYAGLLYWQQVAPVWFFLPLDMMLPILMSVLVCLLDRTAQRAYITLIGGIVFGQVLFQLTLWLFGLDYRIGGEAFLLSLCYSLLLMSLFRAGWRSFSMLSNFVHRKLI